MNIILILSHLLAAAIGAIVMAVYVIFLMAAAIWNQDSDDDHGGNPDLPKPTDPPTVWKRQPLPAPSSATPSSSPAPAAAPPASAPAASTLPVPPLPTSARLKAKLPNSSAIPATSAPLSAAPPDGKPRPRATATLLDGPLDGLDIVADHTLPLTIQSPYGLHSYIPTDRFDLNRRVFLYCGPAPLP